MTDDHSPERTEANCLGRRRFVCYPPLTSNQSKRAVAASVLLVLVAAALISTIWPKAPASKSLLYKGKPLESWFYGARSNFFLEVTQESAQQALNALGTNSFPFLLSNLRGNTGDG